MARFVNREEELATLTDWWRTPRGSIALVWGRRRVGKSTLLSHFAEDKRTIFYVASGKPLAAELAAFSLAAASVVDTGYRDLRTHPFVDWTDALQTLAVSPEPVLVVLDEFPELLRVSPVLPNALRAVWDRIKERTALRLLLCGSAMRVMEELQDHARPLYGRLHPKLLLHPLRPHEAALMLPDLSSADRALVWGIVGGMPLYPEYWDAHETVGQNLSRLFLQPGAQLLSEGELLLAADFDQPQDVGPQVLYAIAAGKTRWAEIKDAVGAKPDRALERLMTLRLVERIAPVTEEGQGSRRAVYRISDNFLSFWLSIVAKYRTQIERGLGRTILPVLTQELTDAMGRPWEAAFRAHLTRLAVEGQLGAEVTAIGPWWSADNQSEIDALVLAGRARTITHVGEAKWAKSVDGGRIVHALQRKAAALPRLAEQPEYIVCAREAVSPHPSIGLTVTADDIFGA